VCNRRATATAFGSSTLVAFTWWLCCFKFPLDESSCTARDTAWCDRKNCCPTVTDGARTGHFSNERFQCEDILFPRFDNFTSTTSG
jgi:hypothetical protein